MSEVAGVLAFMDRMTERLYPALAMESQKRGVVAMRRAAASAALDYVVTHRGRGRKIPKYAVETIAKDYLEVGHSEASKLYRRKRNTLRRLCARHKVSLRPRGPNQSKKKHKRVIYALDRRGYYRETTQGRQKFTLHRKIWEDANGLIPAGFSVKFAVDNLVAMTRGEASRLTRLAAQRRKCL